MSITYKKVIDISNEFDTIIIGTGQGGTPFAKELASRNLKVAVIERDKLGGTCINWGCTPTKTLYASARVAHVTRRAKEYGVENGTITVDFANVMKRKNEIVSSWEKGVKKGLEQNPNIVLFLGEGSFVDSKTVKVKLNAGGEEIIKANRIVINTGARARIASFEGLNLIDYLDNKKILSLETLPEHLVIVGGGFISMEFGQMFRRFGSKVTIIERSERLVAREDNDVSEIMESVFKDEGIDIKFSAQLKKVTKQSENKYSFTIESKGVVEEIQGSHLLLAIGRVPNSESLNLKAVGVETDKNGFVKVNESLETNIAGIYALGDVKPGPQFTHISYDDFRILRDNLLDGKHRTIHDRSVPNTVFVDPQLGRVGLNETEAKKQNIQFDVYKMPMAYIARAIEMSEEKGFLKVLVNPEDQTILGVTVFGYEGGEMMAMLQIAMEAKMTIDRLRDDVFAHPTLAEGFNNLFSYYKL